MGFFKAFSSPRADRNTKAEQHSRGPRSAGPSEKVAQKFSKNFSTETAGGRGKRLDPEPGVPGAEAAPTHLAGETLRPREALRRVPGGPEGAFGPGPRAGKKKVVLWRKTSGSAGSIPITAPRASAGRGAGPRGGTRWRRGGLPERTGRGLAASVRPEAELLGAWPEACPGPVRKGASEAGPAACAGVISQRRCEDGGVQLGPGGRGPALCL